MTLPERKQSSDIKLAESARRILENAQVEAVSRGHKYIGSEHLLLAIMDDSTSVACKLIAHNLDVVRRGIEDTIGKGVIRLTTDVKLELTPKARDIFKSAIKETREENATPVDTQHILFGIIKSDTVASGFLQSIGIGVGNIPELRRKAKQLSEIRTENKPVTPEEIDGVLADLKTIFSNDISIWRKRHILEHLQNLIQLEKIVPPQNPQK
jgi:ATP-dependent Clp protease ATP-binding subunit ClpA